MLVIVNSESIYYAYLLN